MYQEILSPISSPTILLVHGPSRVPLSCRVLAGWRRGSALASWADGGQAFRFGVLELRV